MYRPAACTGEYVAPVSLAVDEQFLLSQFDESLVYRGIAVGVKLHGLAYDAGHLVVAAVFHALHDMEYASLDRLQSVFDMGNGALQDNVGGIVEKPVLVHAGKLQLDVGFVSLGYFVGRVALGRVCLVVGEVGCGVIFLFVVHRG